jgi:hypothetical protein
LRFSFKNLNLKGTWVNAVSSVFWLLFVENLQMIFWFDELTEWLLLVLQLTNSLVKEFFLVGFKSNEHTLFCYYESTNENWLLFAFFV